MKWVSIIAVVVLALALVAETFFLVQQIDNLQQMTGEIARLQQEVADSQTKYEDLVEEKNTLQEGFEKVTFERTTFIDKSSKLEQEVTELSEENKSVKEDLKTKTNRVSELLRENKALESKFMCDRILSNVDFSSNEAVNKSLKKYVSDTKNLDEAVSASYWNLIWTGDKYSTHTVEVNSVKDNVVYVWKFTVYYRGESYGDHENGIFYNDDQCWLYLDK